MKVKYVKNREIDTPNVPFPVRNPREYLKIGKEYNVYGILFYKGELLYFIVGEHGKLDEVRLTPTWEPLELFEVVDSKLPPDWYFRRSKEHISEDKLTDPDAAYWGYKELACDINHNDNLISEREPEAIKIFLKRKKEIDEWEEGK
jgi:hypothetical protein